MASRQGWLCTWPEMLALLDNLKKKLLRLCRFECGHNVSSENFYKGHKSPFGYEHTLCDHVAIKSYAEIQCDFSPKAAGKIAVGSWVTGRHKTARKRLGHFVLKCKKVNHSPGCIETTSPDLNRFSGEVVSLHPENDLPFCKVKNVRTGKTRMLLMSLAQKCHSVGAFLKVCISFFCLFFDIILFATTLYQQSFPASVQETTAGIKWWRIKKRHVISRRFLQLLTR